MKFKKILWHIADSHHILSQLQYNLKVEDLHRNTLYSKELGINPKLYCKNAIIVSLTTYGKRIYTVHQTIESLMQQTMKANKIILWLDFSFKGQILPATLQLQQKRGLEIKFCEDIRSYKKLIPTLDAYPEDAIITVDDDLIYPFDMLEKLIIPYLQDPNYIYCNRIHEIKINQDGLLCPYKDWNWTINKMDANMMYFPTGGAGTLYPPHSLNKEVFNKEVYMNICKYGDDIWFKAMAMLNGTLPKKVYTHNPKGEEYIIINEGQDLALYLINNGQSQNDVQIKAVFERYNLIQILKRYVDKT